MRLGTRKIVVITLIGLIFLAGNVLAIANWLADKGVPEKANWLRENFLTGTTIGVTVILLILLVSPKDSGNKIFAMGRRCPVCDSKLVGQGSYCSQCGSKI